MCTAGNGLFRRQRVRARSPLQALCLSLHAGAFGGDSVHDQAEHGPADAQKEFLGDHLLLWVPAFCDEVMKHCSTAFYREVAAILREYLSSDYEGFKEK